MQRLSKKKGTMDVTNRNTPRAIRARLNFPRRRQVADAGTPEQVAQQVARSSSGKVAMGPWIGSFGGMQGEMGGMAEEPPSPTLFCSDQGRVFADLSGAAVSAEDLVMGPEAATAGRGAEVTPRQPGMALAAKRDQMDALRRKEEYGRAPRMRAVPFNNAVRRQRRIMQCRRHNDRALPGY